MATAATTVLCTHIWRCILLLLFRGEYAAALVCIQTSAAISDARVVNIACGRYVAFFLKSLLERAPRGVITGLERDEEMMALVSGDLQSRTDGGWVWQHSESGTPLSVTPPQSTSSSNPSPVRGNFTDSARISVFANEEQDQDWKGWHWIEQTTQYLLGEQQRNPVVHDRKESDSGLAASSRTDAAFRRPSESGVAVQPASPPSSSRMTIASII